MKQKNEPVTLFTDRKSHFRCSFCQTPIDRWDRIYIDWIGGKAEQKIEEEKEREERTERAKLIENKRYTASSLRKIKKTIELFTETMIRSFEPN